MNAITDRTPIIRVRMIIISLGFLVVLGTVLFKFLEPFTWIQSFYFTVSTMTTVGYGDLVPTSDLTRLAVALYIIVSVSLYVSFITFLGSHLLETRVQQIMRRYSKKDSNR